VGLRCHLNAFSSVSEAAGGQFLAASRLVSSATSLGGMLSTADRQQRSGEAAASVPARFSASCEDPDDLVADEQSWMRSPVELFSLGSRSRPDLSDEGAARVTSQIMEQSLRLGPAGLQWSGSLLLTRGVSEASDHVQISKIFSRSAS
jgi:hypothetical protein